MKWVLLFVTLPAALVCWILSLVSLMLNITKAPRWEPFLVLSLELNDHVAKHWAYSITLPRVIVYCPGARDASTAPTSLVEQHEHIHIRQIEDSMFVSFLLGLCVLWCTANLLVSGVIWLSGAVWLLLYYVTAAMRHGTKKAYLYAEHEAAAYSQTDLAYYKKLKALL